MEFYAKEKHELISFNFLFFKLPNFKSRQIFNSHSRYLSTPNRVGLLPKKFKDKDQSCFFKHYHLTHITQKKKKRTRKKKVEKAIIQLQQKPTFETSICSTNIKKHQYENIVCGLSCSQIYDKEEVWSMGIFFFNLIFIL